MSSVGFFGTKIFYYIQNNKTLAKISTTPLWHTYQEPLPEAEEYAKKVMNSSLSVKLGLEHTALIAYGDISGDSPYITLKDEDTGVEYTTECVSSPCEYYFTDLVFIQQKYEEAIIDFYNYKVYCFFLAKNETKYQELLNNVDESIDVTILLAQENGIQLSKEKIFAKYQDRIDILINGFKNKLHYALTQKKYIPPIGIYQIGEGIRDFYLNPSYKTYEDTLNSMRFCIKSNIEHRQKIDNKDYQEGKKEIESTIKAEILKHQIFFW